MATPRYKLVDDTIALSYHVVSSCVRRAWLCGQDKRTGKDYSHRKRWLVERMLALARCFAVEIDAYAVMSMLLRKISILNRELKRLAFLFYHIF